MGSVVVSVAVGALTVVVGGLGLVVVGLIRTVDDIERRVAIMGMATPSRVGRSGLPVGSPVPAFEARTIDGAKFDSESWSGQEHLVLFAHPGCPPCEELVPPLLNDLAKGALPPTVIVSEGPRDRHPSSWSSPPEPRGRLAIVLQQRSVLARKFETFITPHLFVVSARGRVMAQGVAGTPQEVKALLKRAHRQPDVAISGSRG